ncbi:MAG: alpha/beta hydrolase family protein [Gemmatimonadales bacterium]
MSAAAPAAEEWQLATAGGILHGTLLVPPGRGTVPVVLIHPGSGPTDRDGNSRLIPGKNNSLRLLAEGLASRGIASLRIDKRGVGGSMAAATAESDLRVTTFVDDAVGWLDLLKHDSRFSALVAVGHSEGALILALAAARRPVDGYVSLAGIARRASDVLRRQLYGKLSGPLAVEGERILSALERGMRADSVPAALLPLFRPSVQPYLISWFRILPADAVARLDTAVLVIQGTTDLQVDTLEAALLLARRPDARYLQVTGMNHVLKLVAGQAAEQVASYGDSTLMVAPALLTGLADFVRSLPISGRKPAVDEPDWRGAATSVECR